MMDTVRARGDTAIAATRRHTILFLAANPGGTDRLALDREARSIHLELRRSGYRDRFAFETRWAAEPLDLLRELRALKPTVVHFSGHGDARGASASRTARGLYFHEAAGAAQVVSADAVACTLQAAGASVKLVVLNACFTAAMADALIAHVDCVIGMAGSIRDDAARSFAIGLYGGLGEQESIFAAFEQGKAALDLEGLRDAERPQLKVRAGCDARQLVLAAVPPIRRLDVPCPYPGMRSYAADDAAAFHGRDAEVHELIHQLRTEEREIYVVGPSGSGKSSLIAAGVLPQLARGVAGLGRFVVRTMRPGEQPMRRLCDALEVPPGSSGAAMTAIAAGDGDASLLLVVDQLEELFTLAPRDERDGFLAALRALRAEPRCAVIVALRADFFGALMESSLWPERCQDQLSLVKVSPLRGQALRDAIAIPARDVGVTVEPELIERLLADAASEPGILPLLQEAMVQLWDRRTDQTLTLDDYQALGDGERNGLAIALARRGDATLRRLDATQTGVARRILLRLISFGEGRSDTRRQQLRAQLWAAGDDVACFELVLQTMVASRLLTVDDVDDESRVDLAHEIMISAWPTLVAWIGTHRVDEQRRRRLEAAAIEWAEHGRTARGLLDAIELADAEQWRLTESAVQVGHSDEVMALIAASSAALSKQRRRRRRAVGAVFAALTTLALVGIALAIAARDGANRAKASDRENQRQLARMYEEQGRQLVVEERYQEAMPYLLEAGRNGGAPPTLRILFHAAKSHLPVLPALEHQGWVLSAELSPDGTRVVTASADHTARVWNAVTGEPITGPLEHHHLVMHAAFSRDGTRVVTASWDSTARVWDASTGNALAGPLRHHDRVLSAAFSPDGARVVTASRDNTARVWNASTGEPITGPLPHQARVVRATFSPDGARILTASWDKTARVWDAATGAPLIRPLEHHDRVWAASFSPDGTRILTASEDNTARVWDAATGEPLTRPLEHHNSVMDAAFSPDGTRVVSASVDRTAQVWDAATGEPITGLLGHQGELASAAFSPDGTRIVTASHDNTARVWDAATGKPLTSVLEHQQILWSAAFSPDGTRIITASDDQTARVWSATTGTPPTGRLEHPAEVRIAAFSPDGTRIATASDDRTVRVWDVATALLLASSVRHQAEVASVAFSPDGTRVVTASHDKTARVWDAATGTPLTPPLEHQDEVWRAAFSPDGRRVVTASWDKTARVWDATTGTPLTRPFVHHGPVFSAAFSADGTRVVTASDDKTARVWDAATGAPLTGPLQHQERIWSAVFSADGTRIVTVSEDKTARVWDAATGTPVTRPLPHRDGVEYAAFSPDGTRVVTASRDHTARVWDAVTGAPIIGPLQHQAPVRTAAFSPDGTRVVTASDDKTARVWDAVTGAPLSPPLEHRGVVRSAAFDPSGTRVVTASADKTARIWDVQPDLGTLEQWIASAKCSPFVLVGGAIARHAPSR